MKRLLACIFLLNSLCAYAEGQSSHITWQTNYNTAVQEAKTSNKPMVILFTGSDWCTWCIKLEREALDTADFASMAGSKFVFLKLDFPINSTQPPEVASQNKQLQKRFNITGYPSVVVYDAQNDKVIGTTGYKAGGGRNFAAHLLRMIQDNHAYLEKVKNIGSKSLSSTDLKQLYAQATELGYITDAEEITRIGMQSDQKYFFLLERYRQLVDTSLVHSDEAAAIRKELLSSDPDNTNLTYYQLALMDFEASCRSGENETTPLVDYIQKFGSNDKDHLWRLQMIISQVYFDKDKLSEALEYAKSSLQSAPEAVQPEIAIAIKNIQAKLAN